MTIAVDPAGYSNVIAVDAVEVRRLPGIVVAATASIGAGAVHAAAIGIHAEHPPLARIFVAIAVLQLGAGLLALVHPNRLIAAGLAFVNAAAVTGWIVTRVSGISWIGGLEVKEAPQFADTACALMGLVAVGAGVAAALVGWRNARPARLWLPSLAAVALTVPAMVLGGTHTHADGHGDSAATSAETGHGHSDEAAAATPEGNGAAGVAVSTNEHGDDEHGDDEHDDTATTAAGDDAAGATDSDATGSDDATHGHDEADDAHATEAAADDPTDDDGAASTMPADHGDMTDAEHAAEAEGDHGDGSTEAPVAVDDQGRAWPWPFDPNEPLNLSGVPQVSVAQEARAEALVKSTLVHLPAFADVNAIGALGYSSIGDSSTGYEHYINRTLIDGDEKFLDPTAPESLVFMVDRATGTKTLVSAMFIAKTGMAMDAPELADYAGPLITWHAHNNLCWAPNAEGRIVIVGLTDANGNCASGVRGGGDNPMVHVWIVPHQCGPFAALEGVGAGGAAVPEAERTDMCNAVHGEGHGGTGSESDTHADAPATGRKYDPTKPIDLGGFPGVTEEQQAAAENIVAENVMRLPKWADYKVAEAFGFHSIGDGRTGTEHFVNWASIDDDVWLDPDHTESLVYEPQPDGTRKLVAAMYMLPRSMALEDVPDIGGSLMQWHIHDNLCYTTDPVAPTVGGLTDGQGNCPAHLQKFEPAAMIHVWITPHPCGPFAALEGIGAGQIEAGEERLCDEVHGGH